MDRKPGDVVLLRAGNLQMQRQWYLIDDDGIHPLNMADQSDDFWTNFTYDGDDDAPWPAFNQTVVDASPSKTVDALSKTAPELGVCLEEVTDDPARWHGGLMVARADELTLLGEPDLDLDDRLMALSWTEQLIGELRCDGAFFGYDPAAKTLHLTVFSKGAPQFAWSDSLTPGPSYAMIFDDEGNCVDEDPRRFALRMLGMPETSPLLDRYQFVESQLAQMGLNIISPDLGEYPVAAVLRASLEHRIGHGR